MTLRQRRMMAVMVVLVGISAAAALALTAFRKNLLFFYSPTQIVTGEAPQDSPIRLGGLVVESGVVRKPQSLEVRFDLTDLAHTVTVAYTGILPDLFREGQGIIAHGRMRPRPDHAFEATEVLAKHDENYMPPEVAGALAKAKAKP